MEKLSLAQKSNYRGRESQQLFVYLWMEQLNPLTIDTYRSRLMNSRSILHELMDVMINVETGVWHHNNIRLVALETMKIIEHDPIINERKYAPGLKNLVNSLQVNKQTTQFAEVKAVVERVLLELDECYLDELIVKLDDAIQKADETGIHTLTRLLSTELTSRGYSRSYLYRHAREIFLAVSGEAFQLLYNRYFQSLEGKERQYEVLLRLDTAQAHELPARINGFDVLADEERNAIFKQMEINNVPGHQSFFSGPSLKTILKTSVNALDPYTAAVVAKAKFGSFLDLLHYGYQEEELFHLFPKCFVKELDKKYQLYELDEQIDGFKMNNHVWLQQISTKMDKIQNDERCCEIAQQKLRAAMRYFRMSKEAMNIEYQFLNLWISIEQLMRIGDKQSSIIEPIQNYLPSLLVSQRMNRILRNLRDDFFRCKVEIPKDFSRYFDKKNQLELMQLLKDRNHVNGMVEWNRMNPLLQYRVKEIHEMVTSSNEILLQIENSIAHLEWNLARIYRIRNSIVHNAAYDLSISGVTANLLYYVTQTINCLLYELSADTQVKKTLQDTFIKYKFSLDTLRNNLKKDRHNQCSEAFILNPMKELSLF